MARIGILGATGYTGVELGLILERHPDAEIAFLSSEASAGQRLPDVFPRLAGCRKVAGSILASAKECTAVSVDVVFSCLPHGASAEACLDFVRGGATVIDLSADFRLKDPTDYVTWYGKAHAHPDSLAGAVYSIPELHRKNLPGAKLVANPGCYPTSILLPLVPLVRAGLLGSGTIIADSKSGVSGMGRKASLANSYCEVNESILAYKPGRSHQHLGELDEQLAGAAGHPVPLLFTPHLVPMDRGILSTLYVPLAEGATAAGLRETLSATFADEPFVKVLGAKDGLPSTGHVARTNRCHIAVVELPVPGTAIVVAAIDNVVKGASGQAVQNWNALSGIPETTGFAP